jgi:hypothetical protein
MWRHQGSDARRPLAVEWIDDPVNECAVSQECRVGRYEDGHRAILMYLLLKKLHGARKRRRRWVRPRRKVTPNAATHPRDKVFHVVEPDSTREPTIVKIERKEIIYPRSSWR